MIVETRKLIRTVKKLYPVVQFFKDRYFPDGPVYYSEKALIETKNKGRKMAPFVVPVVGGIAMEHEGYRAREIEAPYIAPKMPITASELERKAFGESPESDRTPEERENEIEAEHLDDLRQSILRRMESMCTSIITDGRIIMNHYASAEDAATNTNPDVKLLQFFDETFENQYKMDKPFTEMTAQEKIMVLYKMASKLKKRGFKATDMLMTEDVSVLLMTDKEFLDYYDKSKVNMGSIDPKELPDGVTYNGSININGIVMSMFTYDNNFEDMDGTIKEMLPAGTIAFLHPGMGETAYAQVTFVKDGSFHSYADKIIPRIVSDEKTNMIEVQTFSRPVPYPFHCDSWLVTNIYDGKTESVDASDGSDEIVLKTEDEINAMSTKAPLIEYGKYIGMTDEEVNDNMLVADLKTAILNYQEEMYPEAGQ